MAASTAVSSFDAVGAANMSDHHSTQMQTSGTCAETIYLPNTTSWNIGDLVIHDCDAKRPDMLMVVIGCSRAGVYRTRYAFPKLQPRQWRTKVWRNTAEHLHDPRRFGILLKRSDPFARLTIEALRQILPEPSQ